MATAFFLMFPEGQELVRQGGYGDVGATWRSGTVVLAGFLLGVLVDLAGHMLLQHADDGQPAAARGGDVEGGVEQRKKEVEKEMKLDAMEMVLTNWADGGADVAAERQVALSEAKGGAGPAAATTASREGMRAVFAICVGDSFHNFADGIFIGAAFKTCGASVAWTVALSSVAHELTQARSPPACCSPHPARPLRPPASLVIDDLSSLIIS